MKKLLFLTVFFGFFEKIQGQDTTKVLEEIDLTIQFSPYSSFDFEGNSVLEIPVSLDIGFSTAVSHHHFAYETPSNSWSTLNGIFLDEEYDLYVYYSRNFSQKNQILTVGLERWIPGKWLDKEIFLDFGTDFKILFFTMGISLDLKLLKIR